MPEQPTLQDVANANKARREKRPTFFQAVQTTFENDSSLAGLGNPTFAPDVDFTPETYEELTKRPEVSGRMDKLYRTDRLARAESEEHFMFLLEQAEEETRREEQLALRTGVRIATNFLDPLDWAVSAAAAPLGIFSKGNKLRRAIKSGTAAGGTNALIEANVVQQSALRDESDIVAAALFGFAIGAPLGSLGRGLDGEINAAANRTFREMQEQMVFPGGNPLADVGNKRVVRRGADGEELTADIVEDILADEEPDKLFMQYLQRFQFNYANTFRNSTNELARKLGNRLVEVGVPLADRTKTKRFTAEGRKQSIQRTMDTLTLRSYTHEFHSWLKEAKGHGRTRAGLSISDATEFAEEVSAAVRGLKGTSPQAQKVASHHAQIARMWLRAAQDADVKGFENVKHNPNYLPRMWHSGKLSRARQDKGADALERWLRGALRVNGKDFTDPEVGSLINRMARGMANTLNDKSVGVNVDITQGINLEDLDMIRATFGHDADEVINALEELKVKKGQDKGKPTRAKQRAELDETYINSDFKGIGDLTESDYRKVMLRYSNVIAGHIGLANEAGIKSKADYVNIADSLRRDGAFREADALDELYRLLTGASYELDPRGNSSAFARMMVKYNFIRVGGGFGIAQLPELANPIAFAGIANTMAFVPEFRKFVTHAKDGRLDSKLARELDDLFAGGTDFLRAPALAGFAEDVGVEFGNANMLQKFADTVDPALTVGSRITSALSGMAPVLIGFQRFAQWGFATRFAQTSRGKLRGKKLETWQRRMRDAGLDDAMQARIQGHLKAHGTFKKGGKLESMNVHLWGDIEAVDAYRMAGTRFIRRSIQENDLGNEGSFIQGPFGRMAFQFMSFMFNSINKQLLHGLAMQDSIAFAQFGTAMFFAGLAYIAQNAVNYANDPDKRAERLETAEIAKAALARAGFAAIVPPLYDNLRLMAGFEPFFGNVRTSGLGTTVLTANPTVTALQDAVGLLKTPGALLHDDYAFSQEITRRVYNLAPFHNLLGVRNALAAINQELPKTSGRR